MGKKRPTGSGGKDRPRQVTSLDEIRAQAAPDIIEIPGFRPGTTINIAVQAVDLTPYILETGISNPILAIATKKAQEGKTRDEIAAELEAEEETTGKDLDIKDLMPVLDTIAREALVEPTYDEITSIRPLTLDQKLAIFDYATGEVAALRSFRPD